MWCNTDDLFLVAIKAAMSRNSISIAELAKSIDISFWNLSRILEKKYSPPLYLYERIFNVLDINLLIQ